MEVTMVTSFIEKRVDKRADVEETAKYKILGENESSQNFEYAEATTKNISRGGVCMVVPHKINEGNVIRVEIPVEKNERPIKAFCEVQWCRPEDNGKFEVGLSFIALKEEDVEHLNNFVNEHAM
jgi:c-di-GMP-binding flagellar brake protein YcgR